MTTTFVNGTGNVIGSHSAQDFTWAGRAETSIDRPSFFDYRDLGPEHYELVLRKSSQPMVNGEYVYGLTKAYSGNLDAMTKHNRDRLYMDDNMILHHYKLNLDGKIYDEQFGGSRAMNAAERKLYESAVRDFGPLSPGGTWSVRLDEYTHFQSETATRRIVVSNAALPVQGIPTFALGQGGNRGPLLMNKLGGSQEKTEEELVRTLQPYVDRFGYVYNSDGLTYEDVNSLVNKSGNWYDDWEGYYRIYLWNDGNLDISSKIFKYGDDEEYMVDYRDGERIRPMNHMASETATHTPEMEQPYTGPITEPLGSEVQFGAEKGSRGVSLTMWISGCATIVGIGGLLGIAFSKYLDDLPFGIGTIMKSVKTSWNSKDSVNKILMALTYTSLTYLGFVVAYQQVTLKGASMSKGV